MDIQKEELLNPNPLFPFRMGFWGEGQVEDRIYSPPHFHEHVEMIFCMKGSFMVTVDDKTEIIHENELICIGGNSVHSTFSKDKGSLIFVMFFAPQFIEVPFNSTVERKYISSFLDMFTIEQGYKVIADRNGDGMLRSYIENIHREYLENKTGNELSIKGWFYQIITYLLREEEVEYEDSPEDISGKKHIEKAISFIDKHYNEELSVEQMAQMCNLSYHYFSKVFKKVMGQNFKQYIDSVRVSEAEKLMITKDLSINEVAYKVGFFDQGSFYRLYKRVRGFTPTDFKKKLKY